MHIKLLYVMSHLSGDPPFSEPGAVITCGQEAPGALFFPSATCRGLKGT